MTTTMKPLKNISTQLGERELLYVPFLLRMLLSSLEQMSELEMQMMNHASYFAELWPCHMHVPQVFKSQWAYPRNWGTIILK